MTEEDPALAGTPVAPYDTIDRLRAENERLQDALNERECDMHNRIRLEYDKTVSDCWRAENERLRAAARAVLDQGRGPGAVGCGGDCGHAECAFVKLAALLSERSDKEGP